MDSTTVGPDKSWRLVHNGSVVLMLEELTGYTTTAHTLFSAATEAECQQEIARLGLVTIVDALLDQPVTEVL